MDPLPENAASSAEEAAAAAKRISNRQSKRMSRMDKDKRRSIMVSLKEISDSPMFDFSSLDAIGESLDDDWSSLPPPPALNLPLKQQQVPLKEEEEESSSSLAVASKQRKSGFSSVWSRKSTASTSSSISAAGVPPPSVTASVKEKLGGRKSNTWMSKTASTYSSSSATSNLQIDTTRPPSSQLPSLTLKPVSPTELESSLSSFILPTSSEQAPLKDEDDHRPMSTARMSTVSGGDRRRSNRMSMAGAPIPPPRIRSGILSYPLKLPDSPVATPSELNAEDILSGKKEASLSAPDSEGKEGSALSMLLSPIQEPEGGDEVDDVIIVEEEVDDEETAAETSAPADDETSRSTSGTPAPSLPQPMGYATLTRVPPPSVKLVMNQPAIATSTLARTLAARLEHQQNTGTLPRRITGGGSGPLATLTRLGSRNRSHSQSSDKAPSFQSLSRPGTPDDASTSHPTLLQGTRGRKGSDAPSVSSLSANPVVTLVRNRSRKGSELRSIATTRAAAAALSGNSVSDDAPRASIDQERPTRSVTGTPETLEPEADEDDYDSTFQYPSSSPTLTRSPSTGARATTPTQGGTLKFRSTIKRTFSDAASILTSGTQWDSLTEEERASRKKFAEAVRNLNWGGWRKGIDALEVLASGGDERALEFLDPVRSRFKNPTGCFFMGKHFEEVRGEVDVALAWYAIGAHGGYPAAALALASFLARGRGTDGSHPNLGLAMKWYHAAHANPHLTTPQVLAEAAEGIGRLYAQGSANAIDDGLPAEKDEDGEIIVRDLEVADDDGEMNLTPEELDARWANLPDDVASKRVIKKDLLLAALWFRRAAVRGHAGAKAYLSSMMEMKPHVAYSEAVEHLSLGRWRRGVEGMMALSDGGFEPAERFMDPASSTLRFAAAMQWMGVHFASLAARERTLECSDDEDGDVNENGGVKESSSSPLIAKYDSYAAGWFRRGAKAGNDGCCVRLAAWLVEGHPAVGGKPDRAQAMGWYHRAWGKSGNGPAEAAEGIGRMYAEGCRGKVDEEEEEIMAEEDDDDSPQMEDEDNGDEDDEDQEGEEEVVSPTEETPPESPVVTTPVSPTAAAAATSWTQRINSTFKRVRSIKSLKSLKGALSGAIDPARVDWFKADPLCLTGLPIAINLSRAARWYGRAAFKGSSRAEAALGFLLLEGGGNLNRDLDQAMYHLHRAAKAGVPFAMRVYGECLVSGMGMHRDDVAVGREWIRRAAETGMAAREAVRAEMEQPPTPVDERRGFFKGAVRGVGAWGTGSRSPSSPHPDHQRPVTPSAGGFPSLTLKSFQSNRYDTSVTSSPTLTTTPRLPLASTEAPTLKIDFERIITDTRLSPDGADIGDQKIPVTPVGESGVYLVEDDRTRMIENRGLGAGERDIEMGQLGAFEANVVPEGRRRECCVIL
ncbi:hypothetical protein HDU67_004151 [Dinochytrium kinnereticum]|nr:hypothetical protein HDU67_004151 [Dinochytrium kinnereticum]